jgi:hypothetical protein
VWTFIGDITKVKISTSLKTFERENATTGVTQDYISGQKITGEMEFTGVSKELLAFLFSLDTEVGGVHLIKENVTVTTHVSGALTAHPVFGVMVTDPSDKVLASTVNGVPSLGEFHLSASADTVTVNTAADDGTYTVWYVGETTDGTTSNFDKNNMIPQPFSLTCAAETKDPSTSGNMNQSLGSALKNCMLTGDVDILTVGNEDTKHTVKFTCNWYEAKDIAINFPDNTDEAETS